MKNIKHISIRKGMKVSELVKEMSGSGVMGAGRVARATEILDSMIEDKDCTKFFGVAGAMVPGGMRSVIADMLRSGVADVFVTTGAALTHDLVEALGYRHLQGSAEASDAMLHKKGMDRMYDSYMQNKAYIGLHKFFDDIFDELPKETNIRELLSEIGKRVKDKNSILRTCHDKKIPLFCPALADSGIGLMIYGKIAAGKKIRVDAFEDMKEMMRIAWKAKKKGVFYVGGGVPKNFIQQAMQLAPKPAEYGIQLSTDVPHYGGSSGAELKEGISWGKMSERGNFVDVYCDATIALPLIWAAVKK